MGALSYRIGGILFHYHLIYIDVEWRVDGEFFLYCCAQTTTNDLKGVCDENVLSLRRNSQHCVAC